MQNYNGFPDATLENVIINGKEFPTKLVADIHAGYITGLVYAALNFVALFIVGWGAIEIVVAVGISGIIIALSLGVKKRNRWAALILFVLPIVIAIVSARVSTGSAPRQSGGSTLTMLPMFIMMYFLGKAMMATFKFSKIEKSEPAIIPADAT